MRSGEIVFNGYFVDLSVAERAIIKTVRAAMRTGQGMPSCAALARAIGQRHMGDIPHLIASLHAKARVNQVDFFEVRGKEKISQNILMFPVKHRKAIAPRMRRNRA